MIFWVIYDLFTSYWCYIVLILIGWVISKVWFRFDVSKAMKIYYYFILGHIITYSLLVLFIVQSITTYLLLHELIWYFSKFPSIGIEDTFGFWVSGDVKVINGILSTCWCFWVMWWSYFWFVFIQEITFF